METFTFIISCLLTIFTSLTAYIGYKYQFRKENHITSAGRLFGFLITISILSGIYLIWDNKNTTKSNIEIQQSLKDSLSLILKKIDEIGYKMDKTTGKLIPKSINSIKIKAINLPHILQYIGSKQRHFTDPDVKKIILHYLLKDTSKSLYIQSNSDMESRTLAQDIGNHVKSMGFKLYLVQYDSGNRFIAKKGINIEIDSMKTNNNLESPINWLLVNVLPQF